MKASFAIAILAACAAATEWGYSGDRAAATQRYAAPRGPAGPRYGTRGPDGPRFGRPAGPLLGQAGPRYGQAVPRYGGRGDGFGDGFGQGYSYQWDDQENIESNINDKDDEFDNEVEIEDEDVENEFEVDLNDEDDEFELEDRDDMFQEDIQTWGRQGPHEFGGPGYATGVSTYRTYGGRRGGYGTGRGDFGTEAGYRWGKTQLEMGADEEDYVNGEWVRDEAKSIGQNKGPYGGYRGSYGYGGQGNQFGQASFGRGYGARNLDADFDGQGRREERDINVDRSAALAAQKGWDYAQKAGYHQSPKSDYSSWRPQPHYGQTGPRVGEDVNRSVRSFGYQPQAPRPDVPRRP